METCDAASLTLNEGTHFYIAKLFPCKTCCSLRSYFWKRSERVPQVEAEHGGFFLQEVPLQGCFFLSGFIKHMQNKRTAVQN